MILPKPFSEPKEKKRIQRTKPIPRSSKRPRKERQTTRAGWLRRLWVAVAAYTKATHGDHCFTCGAPGLTGGNWQAGHFVNAGKSAAVRYHPDNLRVQCGRCNVWLRGNLAEYAIRLLDEIGEEKFRRLLAKSRELKQWTLPEIREMVGAAERGGADYEMFYMERYGL